MAPSDDLRKRFERIARRLTHFDLTRLAPEDEARTLADVEGPGLGRTDSVRFLGYYTREGVRDALAAYGIVDALAERGHDDLHLTFDTGDPAHQRLRVYSRGVAPERLLAEVIAHEGVLTPRGDVGVGWPEGAFDAVVLDWLTLRDPDADFTPARPRLPGQTQPGLGLAREVHEMLRLMALRLSKDAIVVVPEHYHNAVLYAPDFRFADPRRAGAVTGIGRDLHHHGLAKASWALDWGVVGDDEGRSVAWPHLTGDMVLPLNRSLGAVFDDADWRRAARSEALRHRYHLDEDAWRRRRADEDDPTLPT